MKMLYNKRLRGNNENIPAHSDVITPARRFATKIHQEPGSKFISTSPPGHVDLIPRNVYHVVAVGRLLINCLVVLTLLFGVAPASVVVLHELSERSTDPETPLERDEAGARFSVSRAASKLGGKPRAADLPGPTMILTAAQSVSLQTLPLAPSTSSPTHLHQLYGVLRI